MRRIKIFAALFAAAAVTAVIFMGCTRTAGSGAQTAGAGTAQTGPVLQAAGETQTGDTGSAQLGGAEAVKPSGAAQIIRPAVGSGTEAGGTAVPTVVVNGTSSVQMVPDRAQISFGVSTEGATAKAAQEQNTKDVNAVLAKLKELEVKDESIQTSGYDMYPQYDYSEDSNGKIIGYSVQTTLTVKDLEIADAGNILTECVAAGINNVTDVSYSSSKYDESYQQALKEAIQSAEAKAKVMAEASGMTLGPVTVMSEGYQDDSARYLRKAMNETMATADAASVSVMPGEIQIQANVSVTYQLQ